MKKTIIISLAVALAFFIFGYFIGSAKLNTTGGVNTYQAGWDAAKKRLIDSGFASLPNNYEVKNIVGQVTAVQDNAIIIKIRPLELLADYDLDERVVQLDNNTKIYILEEKSQAQHQSEMDEFDKKMQEQAKNRPESDQVRPLANGDLMPPELFIKKELKISDIKVGDAVKVMAVDKDIKNVKQFIAAEINIQSTQIVNEAITTPAAATPAASQPVK